MFYKLSIKELKRETPDCVSVLLDVPPNLQETFRFKQGQHLVFRSIHEGQEVRRSYSICSCPRESELRVAVKKLPGGVFSSFLHDEAKVGDELEVMAPQGRFYTPLDPTHQKRYLLVAAGSGITPIISIIKAILLEEPLSEVSLLYGNRHKGSIIFKEELNGLKNRYLERFSVYHMLSRERNASEHLTGRIDGEKMAFFFQHLVPATSISEVFLCGPEGMIGTSREAALKAGIAEHRIHYELFYSAEAEARNQLRAEKGARQQEGKPLSRIRLHLDAGTMEFDLAENGDSILDAALKNGADLPYSCKGGVCATCRCKLEAGEVSMDVNYALEPDELAAGFILACQSHPVSAEVVINFDRK